MTKSMNLLTALTAVLLTATALPASAGRRDSPQPTGGGTGTPNAVVVVR